MKTLYNWIVGNPLRQMYIAGPLQLGFWGGASTVEICQQLSPLSTGFWDNNLEECAKLVDRKFEAFETTVCVVLYFACLFYTLRFVYHVGLFLCCGAARRRLTVPLLAD
jgi:hypothetical protein